jgi:hypothetical protein
MQHWAMAYVNDQGRYVSEAEHMADILGVDFHGPGCGCGSCYDDRLAAEGEELIELLGLPAPVLGVDIPLLVMHDQPAPPEPPF